MKNTHMTDEERRFGHDQHEEAQAVKKAAMRERMAKVRAARKPRDPKRANEQLAQYAEQTKQNEFAGLTALTCCDEGPACCGAAGEFDCKISRGGTGVCSHPRKCALQPDDQLRPEIVRRFNRAKAYLAHLDADKKFPG